LVMDNFRRLENAGARVIARVPVIPTFNNTKKEMKDITGFAAALSNVDEMHFIPFHTLGLGKYKLLAMKYDFAHAGKPTGFEKRSVLQSSGDRIERHINLYQEI